MSVGNVCVGGQLDTYIRNCCEILKLYSWITDSYILDYFTEELWKRLPTSWQDLLSDVDFAELGLWLDYTQTPRYRRPWPLSLLTLRSAVQNLALPRRKHSVKNGPEGSMKDSSTTSSCSEKFIFPTGAQRYFKECCKQKLGNCKHMLCSAGKDDLCDVAQQKKFLRVFQKHVSPKKRHEIFRMAELACQLARELGVNHIVDVGSGVGHLARLLSYGHGLKVCGIEAQVALSLTARKFDNEVERALRKCLPEEKWKHLHQPSHVNFRIGPGFDKSDFTQLLSHAFLQESFHVNACSSPVDFGIVGLHPCGDLAPYLMQIFVDCPEARFLCIAGCCYMKLTSEIGFPMSSQVMQTGSSVWGSGFQLSYEAREMACHAIEVYSRNLCFGDVSALKVHCYRAALESIIVKNWPEFRRKGLKSIKCKDMLQFSEYARQALSTLNLVPPESDLISNETIECLSSWRQVVGFYSLRLMFAPLVETLILVDRLLYLSIKGLQCGITPEFDPEISPRNQILIASKAEKNFLDHFP